LRNVLLIFLAEKLKDDQFVRSVLQQIWRFVCELPAGWAYGMVRGGR
jgi:hypothetical protein